MKSAPIPLRWRKFKTFTKAVRAFKNKSCIYIQSNSHGQALRVGKAKKGMYIRYKEGYSSPIDAAMHGSSNCIFVAAVPAKLVKDIEDALIYSEKPKYNKRGKTKVPKNIPYLIHHGEAPALKR